MSGNTATEPAGAGQRYFRWQAPGKPISIYLSLEAVDAVLEEARRSLKDVPRRGAEVGGLLLGSATQGEHPTVRIERVETVPCQYAYGPSYMLSERDEKTFGEALERWQSSPEGLGPVGFYRTHTRAGLSLGEEDLWLFSAYFSAPFCVALIVKPGYGDNSEAGFFIWENGTMRSEAPYARFPFHPSKMTVITGSEAGPEPEEEFAPAPAEEPSEKLPAPVTVRLTLQPGKELAGPVLLANFEPLHAAGEPPAPQIAEAEPPHPSLLHSSVPEQPAKLKPEDAEPLPEPGNPERDWIKLGLAGALVLTLITIALLLSRPGAPGVPQAAGDPYRLGLMVVEYGDNLHLTWNREAPAFRMSTGGQVVVIDGGQSRAPIRLSAADLREGSVVYRRVTQDVKLRLEVNVTERNAVSETWELRAPAR